MTAIALERDCLTQYCKLNFMAFNSVKHLSRSVLTLYQIHIQNKCNYPPFVMSGAKVNPLFSKAVKSDAEK